MPHHEHLSIEGRIGDIFFHRFVLELKSGRKILVDLGPKGVEAFRPETGVDVVAEGEMKPSELKVHRIARRGQPPVEIEHKKHGPHHHGPHHHEHYHGPHHHHAPADPDLSLRAVARAGLDPIGAPRRKPKHFEVLARRAGQLFECHVEFDGHIRKEKPVHPSDHKWMADLEPAA